MGNTTSIEWAANADGTPGATWNPIRARDTVTGLSGTFCVHASEGCRNCYAETMQGRKLPGNGIGLAYTAPNLKRVEHYLDERMLAAPLKRKKPTTYFLSSMTDVFGEWVPDAMIDRLFAVMALSPQHTFIVVTKRAERMREWFEETWQGTPSRTVIAGDFKLSIPPGKPTGRRDQVEEACDEFVRAFQLCDPDRDELYTPEGNCRALMWRWPLPNVWLVVSVEDQANADERIPHLLATPAAVRGVSCEPLLGAVNASRFMWPVCARWPSPYPSPEAAKADGAEVTYHRQSMVWAGSQFIDWVICGGESGANARPMHPDWARSLRDQCAAAGVPFFFKQWGEWIEWTHTGATVRTNVTPQTFRYSGPTVSRLSHRAVDLFDGKPIPTKHFGDGQASVRVGKARAGRLLDGQEHNARPPLAPDGSGGKDG